MNRDDVVSDDSRVQALVEKLARKFDLSRVLGQHDNLDPGVGGGGDADRRDSL